MLMKGEAIPKNTVRAKQLLLAAVRPRSSRDGSGEINPTNQYAEYLLGKLYLSEDGVPKDAAKAVHYLQRSAEQGNQWAQYQLGKMLLYGKETEQDVLRGMELLDEASKQGNIYADRIMDNYYRYQSNKKVNSALASLRLLRHLARIMKNRLDEENRRDGESGLVDRKLRRQIEEKRQAMGQRM
jgi:TPR repeat protein